MDSIVEDSDLAKEMLKLLGQELKLVRSQLHEAHEVLRQVFIIFVGYARFTDTSARSSLGRHHLKHRLQTHRIESVRMPPKL